LIEANAGSLVNYSINLKNNFIINDTTIPLTLIVSANIDSKYIEIANYSDYPSFVSEMGDFLAYTWILTLDDFKNLSIVFKVKRLNSWNEVTLPSIRIIVPLDPKATLSSIKQIEDSFSQGINRLERIDISSCNFTLFLRNATIMLHNLSYALQNISIMLEQAANQSLKASKKLKEASEIALKSSEQLNNMAGMFNKQVEDLEKLEFVLKKITKLLEKIEENSPFLPDQMQRAIKSLKDRISKVTATISSIKTAGKKIKSASNNLKKLGIALNEAAENMEKLGDMLLTLKSMFNETAFMIYNSTDDMESRFHEMEQLFHIMQQVRGKMETELEVIRQKRLALEMLCRAYEEEKPYIYVGKEKVNGLLVSDNIVIHIACLKLRKTRSIKFSNKTVERMEKARSLNYLIIPVLLGGISSLGLVIRLKCKERIPVNIKEVREIKELISRIEKLNT